MAQAGIRYNNPFNISLPRSGYYGGTVVGLQGQPGYAAFPDMATGYAAGANRLTDYISGNTSYGPRQTIGSLGQIYATDPNWSYGVSQASGIPLNQTLDPNNPTQMAALQQGILTQELGPQAAGQLASQYGPNGSGYGTTIADGAPNWSSGLSAGTGIDSSYFGQDAPVGTLTGGIGSSATASSGDGTPATTQPFPEQPGGYPYFNNPIGTGSPLAPGAGVPGSSPVGGSSSGYAKDVQSDQKIPAAVKNTLTAGAAQYIQDAISNVEQAASSGLTKTLGAAETAVANWFGGITNWFVRMGLIILAVLLIVVGLLKLMGQDKIVIDAAKGALAA
jgi:hypothetical protein